MRLIDAEIKVSERIWKEYYEGYHNRRCSQKRIKKLFMSCGVQRNDVNERQRRFVGHVRSANSLGIACLAEPPMLNRFRGEMISEMIKDW